MTELRANAPLKRETSLIHRGRPLVVILHPGYMELRQKGRRSGYTVDYGAAFDLGAKLAANAARAERRPLAKNGR